MIGLISLDLDGTLLDPRGQITPAAKQAIVRARRAGVRVVLNTGRPIPEAIWFSREAGCDALLSCLGGAALAGVRAGRRPLRAGLPRLPAAARQQNQDQTNRKQASNRPFYKYLLIAYRIN